MEIPNDEPHNKTSKMKMLEFVIKIHQMKISFKMDLIYPNLIIPNLFVIYHYNYIRFLFIFIRLLLKILLLRLLIGLLHWIRLRLHLPLIFSIEYLSISLRWRISSRELRLLLFLFWPSHLNIYDIIPNSEYY